MLCKEDVLSLKTSMVGMRGLVRHHASWFLTAVVHLGTLFGVLGFHPALQARCLALLLTDPMLEFSSRVCSLWRVICLHTLHSIISLGMLPSKSTIRNRRRAAYIGLP